MKVEQPTWIAVLAKPLTPKPMLILQDYHNKMPPGILYNRNMYSNISGREKAKTGIFPTHIPPRNSKTTKVVPTLPLSSG